MVNDNSFWSGTAAGSQNFAGLDLGAGCAALSGYMLSPVMNATVVGRPTSNTAIPGALTTALSVSTCVPSGQSITRVEIRAQTENGGWDFSKGTALADLSRPGVFTLSAAEGTQDGKWSGDPVNSGTYRFYAVITTGSASFTTAYNMITLTTPAGCIPPGAPVISSSSVLLCSAGQSAQLTATGCTGTLTWSTGQMGSNITVTPSGTTSYTATCTVNGCVSSPSNPLTIRFPTAMPTSWLSGNVGTPPVAGCATVPQTGNLTVKGVGNVPGTTTDAFPYVYKTVSGDVTIIAKVAGIPSTTPLGEGPRAGIIFRNSLTTNASFVWLVQEANGVIGNFRRPTDGVSAIFGPSYTSLGLVNGQLGQAWLKLVRTGTTVNSYYSTAANPEATGSWSLLNSHTDISFGGSFLVGFTAFNYNYGVAGAANAATITEAVFSNITINGVAF